jgi:hypothetical protein
MSAAGAGAHKPLIKQLFERNRRGPEERVATRPSGGSPAAIARQHRTELNARAARTNCQEHGVLRRRGLELAADLPS